MIVRTEMPQRIKTEPTEPSALIRWGVLFLYVAIAGVGVLHHEVWRDETHSWLIVKLSGSLTELLHNKAYEGHPNLWYLILYAIKSSGGELLMVQLVHLAMAAAAVYLLLTYAPFPFLTRVLLAFSYFLIYEYAVIARNYAVSVLLLFLICRFFRDRHQFKGHLIITGLLFLLFQTNLFAALIGGVLYGIIILEIYFYHLDQSRQRWKQYALGALIVGAGMVCCLLAILTPMDTGFPTPAHGKRELLNLSRSIFTVWSAFIPLPSNLKSFWNTNVLELMDFIPVRATLKGSLVAILFFGILLPQFRSRLALLGWLGAYGMMIFIFFEQYFGYLRHHGHIFLAAIVFLWVQVDMLDYKAGWPPRLVRRLMPLSKRLWPVVLAMQVIAAAIALGVDIRYPFSANQEVAHYIEEGPQKALFRVGDVDFAAEGVATFLPNHRMYYPASGQFDGFIYWTTRRRNLTPRMVVDSVRKNGRVPALIVLNHRVPPRQINRLHLKLLRTFTNSIVRDERYWLYQYDPARSSAGQ